MLAWLQTANSVKQMYAERYLQLKKITIDEVVNDHKRGVRTVIDHEFRQSVEIFIPHTILVPLKLAAVSLLPTHWFYALHLYLETIVKCDLIPVATKKFYARFCGTNQTWDWSSKRFIPFDRWNAQVYLLIAISYLLVLVPNDFAIFMFAISKKKITMNSNKKSSYFPFLSQITCCCSFKHLPALLDLSFSWFNRVCSH